MNKYQYKNKDAEIILKWFCLIDCLIIRDAGSSPA